MNAAVSAFTSFTIDGVSLWVVLMICLGVFLASFMDAIAGGGGIVSVPVYLKYYAPKPFWLKAVFAGGGTCFGP